MNEINLYISKEIIKLRKSVGWSQSELARQIEVSSAAISKIEKGKTSISLPVLNKLSEIFNISIDDLKGVSKYKNNTLNNNHKFIVKFGIVNKLNKKDQKIILDLAKRLLK